MCLEHPFCIATPSVQQRESSRRCSGVVELGTVLELGDQLTQTSAQLTNTSHSLVPLRRSELSTGDGMRHLPRLIPVQLARLLGSRQLGAQGW